MATLWATPLEDAIEGPLALDEGRLFVSTRDGAVQALDRTSGALLWKRAGKGGLLAAGGGALVLRETDGTVSRLLPATGAVSWSLDSGVSGNLAPVLDGDRVLVAGNGMAAVDLEGGRLLWSAPGGTAATAPPVSAGARILVGEADGTLRCRDRAAGVSLWTYRTGSALLAPAVVGDRRDIYLGTTDHRFVSLGLEKGRLRWRWKLGTDVQAEAALFDGRVLFAAFDAVLYALDRGSGNVVWRAPLPSRPFSAPLLTGSSVLLTCYETYVLGFEAKTGKPLGAFKTPAEIRTGPLLADGHLYIGLRDRSVLALRLGAGESPGPTPHGASPPPASPAPKDPPPASLDP
jgi:outer membrane protein assembly factor BamB